MNQLIFINVLFFLIFNVNVTTYAYHNNFDLIENTHVLSDELKQHTKIVSDKKNIEYDILMAIMYHESRFKEDVEDNYNKNGTIDTGLCQINSVNWDWLYKDHNLDVKDSKDNIESAAVILSIYLEDDYSIDQALAAYAVGLSGMKEGRGEWFVDEIYEIIDDGLID